MLGDAYGAAVVEALSRKELDAMDRERELEMEKERNEDLESAQTLMKEKWNKMAKVSAISQAFLSLNII